MDSSTTDEQERLERATAGRGAARSGLLSVSTTFLHCVKTMCFDEELEYGLQLVSACRRGAPCWLSIRSPPPNAPPSPRHTAPVWPAGAGPPAAAGCTEGSQRSSMGAARTAAPAGQPHAAAVRRWRVAAGATAAALAHAGAAASPAPAGLGAVAAAAPALAGQLAGAPGLDAPPPLCCSPRVGGHVVLPAGPAPSRQPRALPSP